MRSAAIVAVSVALLAPAAARAHGDPASDVLLTQPVFTPLDVELPQASVAQLKAIQQDAKAKGYEVRVAVIATRHDLGTEPSLFGKPQEYAAFLQPEVGFVYKGPLLIVMPSGYGYFEQGKGTSGIDATKRPSQYPDLAQAAVPIVQLLAQQHGVDVAVPPLGAGDSSRTHRARDRILIAVGALVVLALFGAALRLRARRR